MFWIILIAAAVAYFVYQGVFSTFAKLQKIVSSDYEACTALFTYVNDNPDWDFAGSKDGKRIMVKEPMTFNETILKLSDPEEYKRILRQKGIVPFYFKYVGSGNESESLNKLYGYVKTKCRSRS